MTENSSNSKRIAINTILLYIRMFVTMIVGLFTSRVILDSLGILDFGIYNVVGGFVSMFAIVRSGLVSSTLRFIAFDLGKGNAERLNKTFSTITLIYIILCLVVLIIAESIGYWFIEQKLNIPVNRIYAAKWVFQLSLLTLVATLLSSPYNSLIIAHERMKAFAYITIYEVFAKLVVAYILYITHYDKLIVYAILLCIVQLSVPLMYWIYCKFQFQSESKIHLSLEWKKIKEIYAFAGWSMMGGFAHLGFTQGLNMLLGAFFSPVVNAARAIAVQVQSIVTQFFTNFQMAVDPQIIKSYARGDSDYMSKLVSYSSRLSYYLLLFISLPIMVEAETLLHWWLIDVPEYTSFFFRLIIVSTVFDAISNPYGKAIHATGKIRNYQLVCSLTLISIVPIAYFVLLLGGAPYTVFVVHIIMGGIAMMFRIYFADRIAGIPFFDFIRHTGRSILIVTLFSPVVPVVAHFLISNPLSRFFTVGISAIISVAICTYFAGLTRKEKIILRNKAKEYVRMSLFR